MSEDELFHAARLRKIYLLRQEMGALPPVDQMTVDRCDRAMDLVREITRLEYEVALRSVI